jgi:hypothetical protein
MTDFEFFFSFFGLLLGLTVAEVAVKLADALGSRHRVSLGILTPALALFFLCDITSFWLWAWSARDLISISWPTVYGALAVAVSYFLAAALVFPRTGGDWTSLDDYYWKHKRLVIGGVMFANAGLIGFLLAHALPALSDTWFFVWEAIYWIPLIALFFARSRRANLTLILLLLFQYLLVATDALPPSRWGNAVGLNGTEAQAGSAAVAPR